ncbi:SIR2 family protein [Halopseudomonas oceani]|uniref:SIR2 family NAD-dependent protein deacylase n=1 Tax=Halopseudomonas oceani TaxID=1708783 RepID=UPI002AA69031|nr:SIR2 family protein [Halopseudomonas oceani]
MSCIDQLPDAEKNNLLTSVYSKNFFLWIGSGFSYNFGYGSWGQVLEKISEQIEYPLDLDTGSPLKAAELLCSFAKSEKGLDEYEFNSIVADSLVELKKDSGKPDWTKKFTTFAPNMIVTTNWDDVLEKLFDGLPNVIVRKDTRPQVSPTGRNIFKIHGDAGRPSSIVVTQTQYFSFQREDTYLNRKIYTLFSESSPIFLGYSLSDPNIGFIYEEVYAHLGEEKPPAYMVIHPSVSDKEYEESSLLFRDKNIFLIKAEIGEFLTDLSNEIKKFKKSSSRFFVHYANIEGRLRETFSEIIGKKNLSKNKVLSRFNSRDSRHRAVSAITEILSNQILFKEFGGELLIPENRMSYREIDQTITAVIWMVNENGYPNYDIKEDFYGSVINLCAKSDGVWDFYTAKSPFENILRISPKEDSLVFEDRIDHIVDVLRWSSPDQIGKCWSTWDVYCKRISWLREEDITEMLHELQYGQRFPFRSSDALWIEKLKDSEFCSDEQAETIDKLLDKV